MRAALRLAALGILVVGIVFWFFGGPNLGWTKTSIPLARMDPVTELEYHVWEKRFVPGVDFVAGCVALAAVVFAASWLARSEPKHLQPRSNQ
jgi:hypothetical protein